MSEQLSLVDEEPERRGVRLAGGVTPAEHAPVARVLVETVHPHLAHEFDYGVPTDMAGEAVPGVRVRVRFAGRLVSGFILDRVANSEHAGELTPLKKVVSPLPVLGPALLELCRHTARRYAGTLPDVLRLAIPPRHARAETAVLARAPGVDERALREACAAINAGTESPADGEGRGDGATGAQEVHGGSTYDPPAWHDYVAALAQWSAPSNAQGAGSSAAGLDYGPAAGDHSGPGADRGAADGGATAADRDLPGDDHSPGPRAAYTVLPGGSPGTGWIRAGLQAAAQVLAAGKSVLWLVPDNRELDAVFAALGPLSAFAVRLSAEQGPQARWTAWTTALTGRTRLVVGTRAAVFAPLSNLGLVLCFDDGNDSYLEQRAPYPHARTVLLERVRLTGAALVMLDYARTVAAAHLVAVGWLGNVELPRPIRRSEAPLVLLPPPTRSMADLSNLPERAFTVIRTALQGGKHGEATGPVLVQVPRTGYAPVVACDDCREVLRCPRCGRPLAAAGLSGPFACRGCGLELDCVRCQNCGSQRVRSVAVGLDGVRRQLGRAFPGVRIVQSGGGTVLPRVEPEASIVVATTGAEPYAAGGYAAAVLMDTLWPGPSLRATERAIARRMRALSLVRANRLGGRAVLLDEDPYVVDTLVRYAPDVWAEREVGERLQAQLPPGIRVMEVTGDRAVCNELLAELERVAEQAAGEAPRVLEIRRQEQRGTVRESDDGPEADAGAADVATQTMVVGFAIAHGDQLTGATANWIAARSLHRLPMPRVRVDDPDAL